MIDFILETIVKPGTEAIVNAANGCGIMGKGIAGAIRAYAGVEVLNEAKLLVKENGGPFEAGDFYVTGPGDFRNRGVKKIYHAVTMKFPGGHTSLDYVNKAMRGVVGQAIEDEIESIAFPGLGTGIGGLNKTLVAGQMVQVAKEYDHLINIVFVDRDESFINEVKKLVQGRK